ncbi:hypothetical protein QY96_00637 [Bacillus thermotolerans]|nr:hypothetical protein QY96_00637 [Bacillus thermotolerans]
MPRIFLLFTRKLWSFVYIFANSMGLVKKISSVTAKVINEALPVIMQM